MCYNYLLSASRLGVVTREGLFSILVSAFTCDEERPRSRRGHGVNVFVLCRQLRPLSAKGVHCRTRNSIYIGRCYVTPLHVVHPLPNMVNLSSQLLFYTKLQK